MKLSKQHIVSLAAGAILTASLGAGALAFAQTPPAGTSTTTSTNQPMGRGVAGTVSAVSGNTVTITGKNGTTYTIDGSAAAITKDMTVGVSAIAVGDTVSAQGTVSGTSVAATAIHDGKLPMMDGMRGPGGFGGMGRGVRGTVSTISGTTLTVTSTNPKDSTTSTYTVDGTSAKVSKIGTDGKPATAALTDVAVGDTVMVAGQVSGTTITAKMIVDGKFTLPMGGWKKPQTTTTPTTQTQ